MLTFTLSMPSSALTMTPEGELRSVLGPRRPVTTVNLVATTALNAAYVVATTRVGASVFTAAVGPIAYFVTRATTLAIDGGTEQPTTRQKNLILLKDMLVQPALGALAGAMTGAIAHARGDSSYPSVAASATLNLVGDAIVGAAYTAAISLLTSTCGAGVRLCDSIWGGPRSSTEARFSVPPPLHPDVELAAVPATNHPAAVQGGSDAGTPQRAAV
jgi:hypothetical protein